jgi:predicted ABC-class ATPase
MKDKEEFHRVLGEIDGKRYAGFAQIIGDFDFTRYVLRFPSLPPESEAGRALFVVRVPQSVAAFPPHLYETPVRRTALEDLLTRKVASCIETLARYDEDGVARRRISIAVPGQKILPRTSMVVTPEFVEARLYVRLPMREGAIRGEAAREIFFEDLPVLANTALLYCNIDAAEVAEFVLLMEDADQIRQALSTRGLVAFVGDGSLLARAPGTDAPEYRSDVPLAFPEERRVELRVPNAGVVRGLGIPAGITVILGDDYSGRIELLRAIAAGIYNHVPGDGREWVITISDAVHVPAEQGRSVQGADVGAFLPGVAGEGGLYSSPLADACAAQAAGVMEALEAGARALLFDEADSSPGFLSRDGRLDKLPGAQSFEVRTLSSRARQMADELGISIVVAGSAAVAGFVPVADTVLLVSRHEVTDVTAEAKALGIAAASGSGDGERIADPAERARWIAPSSIDPSRGRSDSDIHADAVDRLRFGRSVVDLAAIVQLADVYQTSTIGQILHYGKLRYLDEPRPLKELLDLIDRDLSTEGLECLSRELRGDLARPRRYEIAAALNRLPTLRTIRAPE